MLQELSHDFSTSCRLVSRFGPTHGASWVDLGKDGASRSARSHRPPEEGSLAHKAWFRAEGALCFAV